VHTQTRGAGWAASHLASWELLRGWGESTRAGCEGQFHKIGAVGELRAEDCCTSTQVKQTIKLSAGTHEIAWVPGGREKRDKIWYTRAPEFPQARHRFGTVGLELRVPSPQFSVLSSWFSVLGSQFPVFSRTGFGDDVVSFEGWEAVCGYADAQLLCWLWLGGLH